MGPRARPAPLGPLMDDHAVAFVVVIVLTSAVVALGSLIIVAVRRR